MCSILYYLLIFISQFVLDEYAFITLAVKKKVNF